MTKQRPFEAIIFDHDGTLIDTESSDFSCCSQLFAEYNTPLSLEKWANYVVGRLDGYDHLFEELIQTQKNGLTKDILWQQLKELWRLDLENITLMPHVERVITTLHRAGYPLGVATASDSKWARRWLERFALWPYFQVVATSDDVRHNKPAPDVYRFAAAQLGVLPEQCLVFEDSLAGIQSAKAAGMTVVAVPNSVTKTLDFSTADIIIDGLGEVSAEWIQGLDREIKRLRD